MNSKSHIKQYLSRKIVVQAPKGKQGWQRYGVKKIGLLLLILCFSLLFHFSVKSFAADNESPKKPRRVVSLSPSVTEILYEFGLAENIVGVTRYCKYPNKAQNKPSIGGLLDPNFEMIYRLNPDLVIYNEGATSHEQRFKEMHLNTLRVKSTSIEGILASIDKIGRLFDRTDKATALRKKILDQMNFIQLKTQNLSKPRVLVTYWRQLGEGKITEVYIAGNDTFFNDLIRIAGGINAYRGKKVIISPLISAEGILQMNPDVIIEIKGTLSESGFTVDEALRDWDNLADLDAYKNRKIFILHKSYTGIPGPRIPLTMQDIAKCLHPGLGSSDGMIK